MPDPEGHEYRFPVDRFASSLIGRAAEGLYHGTVQLTVTYCRGMYVHASYSTHTRKEAIVTSAVMLMGDTEY